jgi:hypothetical protein
MEFIKWGFGITAIVELIVEGFFKIYYYTNFDCRIIIKSLIAPYFVEA